MSAISVILAWSMQKSSRMDRLLLSWQPPLPGTCSFFSPDFLYFFGCPSTSPSSVFKLIRVSLLMGTSNNPRSVILAWSMQNSSMYDVPGYCCLGSPSPGYSWPALFLFLPRFSIFKFIRVSLWMGTRNNPRPLIMAWIMQKSRKMYLVTVLLFSCF